MFLKVEEERRKANLLVESDRFATPTLACCCCCGRHAFVTWLKIPVEARKSRGAIIFFNAVKIVVVVVVVVGKIGLYAEIESYSEL